MAGFWQLLTGESRPGPFAETDELIRLDILRNLYNVLNARRGRTVGCVDFGLDDVEDLAKSPVRVAQAIKQLIVRFEPRIEPESVTVMPAEEVVDDRYDGYFRASFVVNGKMILPKGKRREIAIRTTVLTESAQVDGKVEDLGGLIGETPRPRRILVENNESEV